MASKQADSLQTIRTAYERVKETIHADYGGDQGSSAIIDFALLALRFLRAECRQVPFVSRVRGKEYCGYSRKSVSSVVSRPVNTALFLPDRRAIGAQWRRWLSGGLEPADFAAMSYTMALAPCLAMELFDRQNRKGPATYFECFIGHIFARTLSVQPERKATLPVLGRQVRLTMDFLFHLPGGDLHVHLPVKMSTRERVVQAWAHQRLFDGAFGEGMYRGIMVLFAETKLDSRTHEVIEICVPEQWLAYQTLLSRMDRIYYFDVPTRYAELTAAYPDAIVIKPFSDFLTEKASVVRGWVH